MTELQRNDIHIISRHSNLSEDVIQQQLKEQVYSSPKSWQRFLQLLFISLGVGFTVAGILFFFAYNWADLDKFVKMGLIEGLLIVTTAVVLFSKLQLTLRQIILTGAAILVGVLYAVFGQIYQTGANAYDFFLGWTLSIILWVIISGFTPLWLLFLVLINTTLILYSNQVAHDWSEVFLFTLLFTLNTLFLIGFKLYAQYTKTTLLPKWFTNIIALAVVFFGTVGVSIGVFDDFQYSFGVLLILTSLVYIIGIKYSLLSKNIFYLAIIPLSVIIILCSVFAELSTDAGMFLMISAFVVGSVSFLIKFLIDLQKKWSHG